jgi:hypothetical protein
MRTGGEPRGGRLRGGGDLDAFESIGSEAYASLGSTRGTWRLEHVKGGYVAWRYINWVPYRLGDRAARGGQRSGGGPLERGVMAVRGDRGARSERKEVEG